MPFFFISLNTSAMGAERAGKMLRAFADATTHLELVPAVDGNASAASYAHADAQYNHLLKRNSMSEVRRPRCTFPWHRASSSCHPTSRLTPEA